MVRSHGTISHLLERKLHSGISKTKAGQGGLVKLSNRSQVSMVYLTIGSCFSVHHRVMEHAGSLESTKEA